MSLLSPAVIWLKILDLVSGLPYKGINADILSLPSGPIVVEFRKAVYLEYSDMLTAIKQSQLIIYMNKEAFNKRIAVGGSEEAMEEDFQLDGFGKCKKEALIVAVPSPISVSAPPAQTFIANNIPGMDLRSHFIHPFLCSYVFIFSFFLFQTCSIKPFIPSMNLLCLRM